MHEQQRIDDLEIKTMHQELVIEQLNQTLILQQQQIDQLAQKLKHVEQLIQQADTAIADAAVETPPPHY